MGGLSLHASIDTSSQVVHSVGDKNSYAVALDPCIISNGFENESKCFPHSSHLYLVHHFCSYTYKDFYIASYI